MVARRKLVSEFVIQGNYGYGWDDEHTESDKKLAKDALKTYRANGGGSYRLIVRRVPMETNPVEERFKVPGKNVRAIDRFFDGRIRVIYSDGKRKWFRRTKSNPQGFICRIGKKLYRVKTRKA